MTIDLPPVPPAVVEFANENGYDIAQKDDILSDKTQEVYKVYSNKDILYINDDKIKTFGLIYVILQNGEVRPANKQEVLNFLKKY